MYKAQCICIYKDNSIYNLTVTKGHSSTTLIRYDLNDHPTPYRHKSFDDLYRDVLGVLKSNDVRCDYYEEFNAKWYDISFIDLNDPTVVSKYGLVNKNTCGVKCKKGEV